MVSNSGGVAAEDAQKKSRRFRRLLKLDNREASNRVDRSHSVSKEDDPTHKPESLIDRKQGIFFSLRLPCRPLAEWGCHSTLNESSRRRPGPITTSGSD